MDQIGPSGEVVSVVHLVRLTGEGWRIACMPGLIDMRKQPGHPGYQRSDDMRAVTCRACKRVVERG